MLHCTQLTLGSPIIKVLGDGGLIGKGTFRATAMQLLHGMYNLQANHEVSEWEEMWVFAQYRLECEGGNKEDQFSTRTMPAPIITRWWWTIGAAAVFLLKNLAVYKASWASSPYNPMFTSFPPSMSTGYFHISHSFRKETKMLATRQDFLQGTLG
eukprot:scaffold5152_cov60-Attheya_sp.AAC.8